jgi:hypothetical protein
MTYARDVVTFFVGQFVPKMVSHILEIPYVGKDDEPFVLDAFQIFVKFIFQLAIVWIYIKQYERAGQHNILPFGTTWFFQNIFYMKKIALFLRCYFNCIKCYLHYVKSH